MEKTKPKDSSETPELSKTAVSLLALVQHYILNWWNSFFFFLVNSTRMGGRSNTRIMTFELTTRRLFASKTCILTHAERIFRTYQYHHLKACQLLRFTLKFYLVLCPAGGCPLIHISNLWNVATPFEKFMQFGKTTVALVKCLSDLDIAHKDASVLSITFSVASNR